MAQARTERERKALREAAGRAGHGHADTCGAGDVDASDGASRGTASGVQDCRELLTSDRQVLGLAQFPVDARMKAFAEACWKFKDTIIGHENDDIAG